MKLKKAIKLAIENDADGVCVQPNGMVVMFYGAANDTDEGWDFDNSAHIVGSYTGNKHWLETLRLNEKDDCDADNANNECACIYSLLRSLSKNK